MSVVSAPLKYDIAARKDIFRLSAVLFSETNDDFSTSDAQLQMVKCMFAKLDNIPMSKADIIAGLLDVYKYHVTEDEIIELIRKSKKTFQIIIEDGSEAYRLTDDVYKHTLELQRKGIDFYIDQFIDAAKIEDREKCKDAIYKYLYELTTTNINSYRILLLGNQGEAFHDSDISVDITELDTDEKVYVRDFLEWNDAPKNAALANVVYTCLEYCLLVSGDSPNSLMKGIIRQRVIYLDTNVIFRALGINGESRKKVIHAFLKKCQQAKFKLVISAHTKKEFIETTNIYIDNIKKYPRGVVDPEAYEYLSDYNLYAFYSAWHHTHSAMSLKYFRIYLDSIYDEFVKQYAIVDDEKIPQAIFTSHTFGPIRNTYAQSIQRKKQENRAERSWIQDINPNNNHDATIIRYIEMLRETQSDEKDIFLVSTDKVLRSWDMGRSDTKYPIVIYPSQLFVILVKLCGRSDDDYKSFVSFIKIKPQSQQITAEKANIILSGISSITEDIEKQRGIIKAAYGGDFQQVIQHSHSDSELYESAQRYSMNYLEGELEDANMQLTEAHQVIDTQSGTIQSLQTEKEQVTTRAEEQAAQAAKKELGFREEISSLTNKQEEQREKVCKFAESQIMPVLNFRWYVIPGILLLYTLLVTGFIALQMLWCDKSWNIVTTFCNYVGTTTFGSNIEAYVQVIDAALIVPIVPLFKCLWKNPWNKAARREDMANRVAKYIKDHDLL